MSVYDASFLYTMECSISWSLTMLFENDKLVLQYWNDSSITEDNGH